MREDKDLAAEPGEEAALDLIPARMLHEWTYCPRVAYLEWVHGEFEDSADTVEGRHQHRRVDGPGDGLPQPGEDGEAGRATIHARSVTLSAPEPGIIARLDLVEAEGDVATPVDYKHGSKPERAEGGVWEADAVQLAAQALILRANGFRCERGVVYYVASRERVEVPITEALVARVLEACRGLRAAVAQKRLPPPLEGSPKCAGCSLVAICLPDETRFVAGGGSDATAERAEVRRLYPILPDALPFYVQEQGATVGTGTWREMGTPSTPFYVQEQGATVGTKAGALVARRKGEVVAEVPLLHVSQLGVFGSVQVSTQVVHELCGRGVPICWFSYGGWFYGMTTGIGSRNIELRQAQFRRADDAAFRLTLARRIVSAKVRNQRTILRRNSPTVPDQVLRRLDDLAQEAGQADDPAALLGIEGAAAALYFGQFGSLLRPRDGDPGLAFDFRTRNRRPPRDPVNAMLSLCYALLAKDCGVAVWSVGFDPHLGFYHTAHHGRQSLALDLMEEFRPVLADSVVVTAINNGEVRPDDFLRAAGAVSLRPGARRTLIGAYERRMEQTVTHPVFGYKVCYRRILEVQARLLARHVLGELAEFPPILVR